ncbi:MAG TPA: hypothetical protein VF193_03455 [Steroidobacter sp.]
MTILSTTAGAHDATSMYVALDTTGFKHGDFDDSAYYNEDGFQWIVYNWGGNRDQWDLLRNTLQSAMLGRLPVRIFSHVGRCLLTPKTGNVRICTSQEDCND